MDELIESAEQLLKEKELHPDGKNRFEKTLKKLVKRKGKGSSK